MILKSIHGHNIFHEKQCSQSVSNLLLLDFLGLSLQGVPGSCEEEEQHPDSEPRRRLTKGQLRNDTRKKEEAAGAEFFFKLCKRKVRRMKQNLKAFLIPDTKLC